MPTDSTSKSSGRAPVSPLRKKPGPFLTRRGQLEVISAVCYLPKRRGARHFADPFSRALLLAKDLPDYGRQWCWDLAALLADLVPPTADLLAVPPQSEKRARRGGEWYLARELAVAVGAVLGLPLGRPLRWGGEGQAGKSLAGQWSKGRALGKTVEVLDPEGIAGRKVALLDDLCTTGITLEVTARALLDAGAYAVYGRTLAWTERVEHRPVAEREAVRRRAAVHKARTNAREGLRNQ